MLPPPAAAAMEGLDPRKAMAILAALDPNKAADVLTGARQWRVALRRVRARQAGGRARAQRAWNGSMWRVCIVHSHHACAGWSRTRGAAANASRRNTHTARARTQPHTHTHAHAHTEMGAPQAADKLIGMDADARNSILESMAPRAAASTLTSMEDAMQQQALALMMQGAGPAGEACDNSIQVHRVAVAGAGAGAGCAQLAAQVCVWTCAATPSS
jgi:hypothetical protein